jgi:hypothetical protein
MSEVIDRNPNPKPRQEVEMLKPIRLVTLPAAALILAACAAPAPGSETQTADGVGESTFAASTVLAEDYEGAVPVMVQLLVGTLELEGTELAVTAEQAAELLPLWKAVRSLSGSDTAAEAEIEAVVDQIGSTLTDEQLRAIAEMQLTQEDLFGVIQELGVLPQSGELVTGAGGSLPGGVFIAPGGGNPPAGGAPGGGVPPAGGGPGGGFITEGPGGGPGGPDPGGLSTDLDPDQIATLEARRESGEGPGARMALFLIDPLIERLEHIAAG